MWLKEPTKENISGSKKVVSDTSKPILTTFIAPTQDEETRRLQAESIVANSPQGILTNTGKGILDIAGKVGSFSKEIVKGVVKPVARLATNVVNVGQIVAGKPETQPFSGSFLGEVTPVGQGETFGKKLADTFGVGLDVASNIPIFKGAGITFDMIKNIKKGSSALKVLKAATVPIIKEGAVGGGLASGGYSLQEQSASEGELSALKTVFDTAFGSAVGAVTAPVLAATFSVLGRVLAGKTPEARKLFIKGFEDEYKIDLSTPQSRYKKYLDEQGYEPYTLVEKLPTIEIGKKAVSDLPIIDITEPLTKNLPKGLRYEEVGAPVLKSFEPETKVQRTITPKDKVSSVDAQTKTTIKPLYKTSSVAENLKTKTIAQDIEANFGDLPQYKTMDMKDQAVKAQIIIDTDYDLAKRIALGDELPPGDLRAGSVYTALEKRAIETGDVSTIEALSKSKLPNLFSVLGQDIKALDVDFGDSPVKALTAIREARLSKAKPESIKSEVGSLKNEIKKVSPDKKTWSEFIKSLEC